MQSFIQEAKKADIRSSDLQRHGLLLGGQDAAARRRSWGYTGVDRSSFVGDVVVGDIGMSVCDLIYINDEQE